ncbi:uncharacterized protein KQ657_001807 [Scheffersomyces spartinae]|uniref:DUF3074 domain-containing protein n=1 Tax=Scheffersomyces spartinae TaxID=45513 RepID=A0A9P7V790_9ASCO|nr:uncharacterized protein KQ657_001807 [Scheffersomyces spartinae]KAG7192408.1 hypothetical protein KQ657_001807 [Scheffersomyces spartinae]
MDINSFGNGISPDTEPDIPQLVQQASSIVSNIESSWAKKKLFVISGGNEVQTYANDQWVARISNHPQAHSKMVKYIAGSTEDIDASHTAYEAQYIDTLSTYDIQKILSKSPTSIAYTAKLVYLMPFPLKDRVFHELIVVHKASAEDGEFFVISIPISPLPSAKLRLELYPNS